MFLSFRAYIEPTEVDRINSHKSFLPDKLDLLIVKIL